MGISMGKNPIASPSVLVGSSASGDESPTDMVRKPSNLSNMVSPLDGGGVVGERQVMSAAGQID